MNIIIKSLAGNGTNISIQVNHSDNVLTLKEMIYKSKGIPVDQQMLIFCGKILEDDCTFSECNIQKDSTVHLALKTKNVTNEVIVKLMRSMETVRLDLTAVTQCTVIDVKQMLQKEWGILPQDQTLMHNGLKLPEECNLFDCGVVEKSELELVVSSHSSVNVQVIVSSSETSISLKLHESMTVDAAKFMISKKLSIQPYQQKLLCTGQKLKGHLTLSHYNRLPEWPNLQLIEKTTICIRQRGGNRIFLHVITKTISNIKKKIEKSEGIPYDQQVLIYGGQKLEENKSLDDYDIADFSELELVKSELMKIHIHVIHSKRVIDCEMRNTSTVRDIKKKVQENIGVTTATKLVLISGGVELKDDCLLCHCSAYCDHSTLQLMLPMTNLEYCPKVVLVYIFVVSLDKTVQIQLDPDDTVRMVKLKIHQQLKIRLSEQMLVYAGLELEDEHKLFEYGIQKNSILQLLISNPKSPAVSTDGPLARDPISRPSTMKILLRLNPELVRYIDFITLLPYLNKYGILNPAERQFLNDDRNQREKQVSNLLEYLEKKNEETVDDFVRAINEEPSHKGHRELCQLLKKEGIAFI